MESVHATQGCCGGEGGAHKAAASHCCCHGPSRHFITKAERREALEQYKDQLKKELTGVEEHLQELG
jgi:predicted N-acyltransferase